MKIINITATTASICMLVVLLFNLYINEYFQESVLFWVLAIGTLITSVIGAISGALWEDE